MFTEFDQLDLHVGNEERGVKRGLDSSETPRRQLSVHASLGFEVLLSEFATGIWVCGHGLLRD